MTTELPPSTAVRVLGCYVTLDGSLTGTLGQCRSAQQHWTTILLKRCTTDKVASYVARAVAGPSLAYRLQGAPLSDRQLSELERPIVRAIKWRCGLPSTAPSTLVHHRMVYAVPRLLTVADQQHLTLALRAINGDVLQRGVMLTRLMLANHQLRWPAPIWDAPLEVPSNSAARHLIPVHVAGLLHRRCLSIPVCAIPEEHPDEMAEALARVPLTKLVAETGHDIPARQWRYAYKRCLWRASDWLRWRPDRDALEYCDPRDPLQRRGRKPDLIQAVVRWWGRVVAAPEVRAHVKTVMRPRAAMTDATQLFTPMALRAQQRSLVEQVDVDEAGLAEDETVEVWTDGSVDTRHDQPVASFAGVVTTGTLARARFAGRVAERPLSSTLAEMMAIAAAVALAPATRKLTVHSDSKAALHALRLCQQPVASRKLNKSPMAYLLYHLRGWLQQRAHPVEGVWVKGHAGTAGNEEADRLAGAAHDDEAAVSWAVTCLPPPAARRHWLHYGNRVVPWRERRVVREQDEAVTALRLHEQLNEAATAMNRDPVNAAIRPTPAMHADDVRLVLETLQWTNKRDGTLERKQCARETGPTDSARRAFGVKQLFDLLPTQLRNRRWYPHVEAHAQCPRCRSADESASHMVRCADQEQLKRTFLYVAKEHDKGVMNWMLEGIAPWSDLHWLQGRVHPDWRRELARFCIDDDDVTINGMLRTFLYAGLVATRSEAWRPRCEALNARHREEGVRWRVRRRQMQARPERGTREPTPRRARSYPTDSGWLRRQHGAFMHSKMVPSTGGQTPSGV